MANVMVTFLGKPNLTQDRYHTAKYKFSEQHTIESSLFGIALYKWYQQRNQKIDRLVLLGTRGSIWDALYELPGVSINTPTEADWVALNQQVQENAVTHDQLQKIAQQLAQLLNIEVHCDLISEALNREEELAIFSSILRHVSRDDSIVLDITHGFRHFGIIAVESILLLGQTRDIHVEGIYYGSYAAQKGDISPVSSLQSIQGLSGWLQAVSIFKKTWNMHELATMFKRDGFRNISRLLQDLHFALMAHRSEAASALAMQVQAGLTNLLRTAEPSLAALFADDLRNELKIFDQSHPADWQLELARKAISVDDLLRASIFLYESMVSASIQNVNDIFNNEKRHAASNQLKNSRQILSSLESSTSKISFQNIKNIRNMLTHGSNARPYEQYLNELIRDPQKLKGYFASTLRFVRDAITELKQRPLV